MLYILSREGFRLFFPLSAIYAGLWPFMWVVAFSFDLPLVRDVPPGLWHAHEMLIGAFGAALIGFLTTAAPEWTDTEPLKGRPLFGLAGLWLLGRVVGCLGWDGAGVIGALADMGWILALLAYLAHISWSRKTDRLLPFVFWLSLLACTEAMTRWSFATGSLDHAVQGVHLSGFAFLGLLGLALARVTVPVTNLILDPSEDTSPFRPHPGRLNLAPSLVLVVMIGEILPLSPEVTGYLFIAAGAAFMDRVGEAFIGRAALRSEILLLAGSSAFSGAGLLLIGASRLGAWWSDLPGLHIALMGGLGLGILSVFSVASLLHTHQQLRLNWHTKAAACFLVLATLLRVLPDIDVIDFPFAQPYSVSSVLWALVFGLWLTGNWHTLLKPEM